MSSSTGIDLTRWVGAIGLAVAVGIVYFLAARLSLALLTKPEVLRFSGLPQVCPPAS